MKNILFVCTGNTCRSSMAEALFKDMLKDLDNDMKDIKVHSAGVFAIENQGASPQAIEAMKNRGIDLSTHKSSMLTRAKVEEADLILTMTNNHKRAVLDFAPEAKSKVFTIKEYAYLDEKDHGNISDPFGMPVEVYEKTAEEIKSALKEVLKKIQA